MICPDCKREVPDYISVCPNCSFDLALYKMTYKQILNRKLAKINGEGQPQAAGPMPTAGKVRCPYCGSTDVVKISAISKIADDAIRGMYATTRYRQWRCKNCSSEF